MRPDLLDRGDRRERSLGDGEARGARLAQRLAREGIELLGLEGLADGHPSAPLEGRIGGLYRASVGSTISGGSAEILQIVIARRGLGSVTLPLEGVRVVEYAQYVAGPLCGVLLADLGADVVKVEPPNGDGYRYVMPVGARGRPLLRAAEPGEALRRRRPEDRRGTGGERPAPRSADVVLHNFPPQRASRFGLGWDDVHAAHPALVVGRVSSFGTSGPLAGAPAYDLVAQARAGLLTAHASRGNTVPARAGGIPMADLTAGFLLATGVLAALVRARETGGESSPRSRSSPRRWRSSSMTSSGCPASRHAETHRPEDRAHLDGGRRRSPPGWRCTRTTAASRPPTGSSPSPA